MASLTGIERISNILKRKPVDRIGLYEHFWSDTHKKWTSDGFLKEDESFADHFGFDMDECWPFNLYADIDFVPQIIEETDETVLTRDGNGALLRRHKLHDSTPEHVDFLVKERKDWEKYIKPLLKPERRRINFEAYRKAKQYAAGKTGFLYGLELMYLSLCIRYAVMKIFLLVWHWTPIGFVIWWIHIAALQLSCKKYYLVKKDIRMAYGFMKIWVLKLNRFFHLPCIKK